MAKWDLSDLDRTAEIHNADMTALTDMLRASKQRNDALDELYQAAKRDAEEAEAYAAELEAKLAKAVEALAAWKHYDESDEQDHVSLMLNYADAIEKTRTTLAELTGGKDD